MDMLDIDIHILCNDVLQTLGKWGQPSTMEVLRLAEGAHEKYEGW